MAFLHEILYADRFNPVLLFVSRQMYLSIGEPDTISWFFEYIALSVDAIFILYA